MTIRLIVGLFLAMTLSGAGCPPSSCRACVRACAPFAVTACEPEVTCRCDVSRTAEETK